MRVCSTAFALALALVPALTPSRASACGGLFCSNPSQPVNQTAERIVFSSESDGSVTAIIEIRYTGTAARFAWVLPVAGSPAVGVSTTAALDRLQRATNPTYQLTTTVEGQCRDSASGVFTANAGGAADTSAAASDAGMSRVTVVDSGAVGPYDYVVIHVDPAATPLATVAVDWLNANGYFVQATGSELLEPYLATGMNLLAFRLTSGADVGSIRPVTVGFGPGLASIPIRPTATAAEDDMGGLVWVLGPARAVPVEYASLELDEALINWLNPSSTYADVVTQAANESGGQGFVTEMAGDAAPLAESVWGTYEQQNWEAIRANDPATADGTLLQNAIYALFGLDGLREAIATLVPIPAGVTADELVNCVGCYYPWGSAIPGFDRAAFLAALDAQVVLPMRQARALFETHAEVTRLFTTMSASEMTRDPSFDFNPDLPDVSNVHTGTRVVECSPSLYQSQAPWRATLPDGRVVRGTGSSWPFTPGTSDLPANARILRVGTSGAGAVLTDNGARIQAMLDAHNATIPRVYPFVASGGGGACTAGHAGARSPLVVLVALLALGFARTRRAR